MQIPPGELDTADLDPDLALRVEDLLSPESLTESVESERVAMPDSQEFELGILGEGEGDTKRYVITDATAPPELLQLLHDLMYEINRRRAEHSGDTEAD